MNRTTHRFKTNSIQKDVQTKFRTQFLKYFLPAILLVLTIASDGCKKACEIPPDDRTLKIVVFESGENAVEIYNEKDFVITEDSAVNFQIPPVLEFHEDHVDARFVMDCDAKETVKYFGISVKGQSVEQLKVTISKTSNEHCECGEMAGTITSIVAAKNSLVQVSPGDHFLRIEL